MARDAKGEANENRNILISHNHAYALCSKRVARHPVVDIFSQITISVIRDAGIFCY
jgi:hypothetical protein